MATDQAQTIHKKVKEEIYKKNLHKAFSILSAEIQATGLHHLHDELKRVEDTYKYMIHYLIEGYADSGREQMLSEIIVSLNYINDSLLREKYAKDSSDLYFSTLRLERVRKGNVQEKLSNYRKTESIAMLAREAGGNVEIRKKADEELGDLFAAIWTMFGESSDSYRRVKEAVIDPDASMQLKSQIISALLLGNMKFYDRKGLQCLLDIYDSDIDEKTAARALTAIFLIVAKHSDRIASDPKTMLRLQHLNDSPVNYCRLREILMNVIKSRDTERISSKMKNEVLPELMKLRPEILNKLRDVSEMSDLEMLDENPEWEEILNKNGLGNKLKELTEMQMEGGDVMMMAFSNLKSFPFFNSVANWFLPFHSDHHDISNLQNDTSDVLTDILDMEGVMCDSDKYSFAFSLARMPESQRQMLTGRMKEQMQQLKEAMADRQLKSSIPVFDSEVIRYIRDLYRFFKLFRRKDDFTDPFKYPVDLKSLPVIGDILSEQEVLNLVGEFYFKRGYYSEALPLLLKLDSMGGDDPLLWEKIGYSYSAMGNLQEALKWYKKAELMHPDSKWLMKKLAISCRLLNRFEEASEYYAKSLEYDPDNYQLLMNYGHCLVESGDIEKALANYYHADYIRPDNASSWRAIAWAEMLNGDFGKSESFYRRILSSDDSNATDYLNFGHLNYLKGDLKEALECYKRSALHSGFGIEKLEKAVHEDLKVIEKLGGNTTDIYLLLDKVKYDLD